MKKLFFFLACLPVLSCTVRYEPDPAADWALKIVSLDTARTQVVIPSSEAGTPVVKRHGKRTEVTFPSVGGRNLEVRLIYEGNGECHAVTPAVTNREEGWAVIELAGPESPDLGVDVEKMRLLVPEGAGFRFLERMDREQGREVLYLPAALSLSAHDHAMGRVLLRNGESLYREPRS